MSADNSKHWRALTRLASDHVQQPGRDGVTLSVRAAGLLVDFSKHRLTSDVLAALEDLAMEQGLADRIEGLFRGDPINRTEQRPALHTALRAATVDVPELARPALEVMARMLSLADTVRAGDWRGYSGRSIQAVVHIGIGGSHLGPELAVDALSRPSQGGLRVHFVANIDSAALDRVLLRLDPETTLFIIASKSFSTLETRVNAMSARSWFLERTADLAAIPSHFIAISTNLAAAEAFGIPPDNVFEMWDWVGGRYSVWSPVGLPVALAIGSDGFRRFLSGARALDEHFRHTAFGSNLPVLMALIGIWNYNFLGINNQAVLPYAERLRLLPDFLQQLTMESNGKRVRSDGSDVAVHTMPVVWGGRGTNGQHAFHQLLHQGTRSFAADFIVVADGEGRPHHQQWLLANALAQSQAMLLGHDAEDPHKKVPGNKGTTTIVLDRLSPESLGALLALYEHVVFCQGVIWDINSFDQWGVELGKRLAVPIHQQLGGASTLGQDQSTRDLIDYLIQHTTGRQPPNAPTEDQ